ncbi:FMN-binding protein [Cryobacterium tagatosivorans]|jgi:uncharacterized protein with FMN-binding domain|uniref:FMN-binding protein n=2 Tax=Cryobacterium tagatosivorans TaxID=1259199 RepID=A0A4R8UFL7_9MICO|nr:FMN-binding protein [Cryobacterium tagatosivorans]
MGVQAGVLNPSTASATAATPSAPSAGPSAAATQPTASAAPSAAAAPAAGTFTGAVVQTQFGDVQVAVTIAGGKIADVAPLLLTDRDGKSVNISNRAAPILRDEVLSAQSANVQNVGGATYTSSGYVQSLQSALDAAGF